MPVRYIIADVDGCLTPEESAPWDLEHFIELARRVREASEGKSSLAPMTLCTGRPQPYVEVLMKLFDVRVPAICESGAVFYTLNDNHAWCAPGATEEKRHGLRALREWIEHELIPANPGTVLQFGKEAQISIFSADPDRVRPLKPMIENYNEKIGGPELIISMSQLYLNISLAGVDKGAAIRSLIAKLGLRREEVAGIGDTEGDLPIREAVGYFACPANATKELKTVADYVSPHSLLEGILDILNRPEMQKGNLR